MMAAFDDVDRVDLHVTKMLHGLADRFGSIAERCGRVEPLGVQPDPPCLAFARVRVDQFRPVRQSGLDSVRDEGSGVR